MLQALGEPTRGCVLFAEKTHLSCPTCLDEKDPRKKRLQEQRDDQKLLDELLGKNGLCDICRLFGSPLLASKLRIADARPTEAAQVTKRDGVGIDRDTESAKEKIKFDFMAMEQYVGSGETKKSLELSFDMQVENADDNDLALLGIVIRELTGSGIDVGGKKARGFGRVKLTQFEVECFDDQASRVAFLRGGALKKLKQEEFQGLLDTKLNDYFDRYYKEGAHAQAVG
jgi:CRISPR-associated protein Csm3